MRQITLVFLNLLLPLLLFAQRDCAKLPTEKQLLESLSKKPFGADFRAFHPGCNMTDSIYRRILYLLDWRWTESEINDYLSRNIKEHKRIYLIEETAKAMAKGNDSVYRRVVDSITRKVSRETLKNLKAKNYYGVSKNVILIAAFVGIDKAKPLLREALKDPLHYNAATVELALARLGDKKYQRSIIAQYDYKRNLVGRDWLNYYQDTVAQKLIFVSSQESIYSLHKWMDTSKYYVPNPHKPAQIAQSAHIVIQDLKYIIGNKDFQEKMKNWDEEPFGYRIDEVILFCKKWLLKNKGKYQINKYYCPY
jgi:hypothetical protein